jgi:hypothetical protein
MAQFYRHSGIVPFGGLVQTVFAGVGTAISLGIAYSYAMVYIPIIYLNFLGTVAFGFTLGYLVKMSARSGRIRNHWVPAAIGFVSGLVGLYFAWGADMLARRWLPPQAGFLAAFNPQILWIYVQWAYENGLWTFGAHAQGPVTGIPLALVWLAEAGTIVGLATGLPWSEIRNWVFCENCGWWETIESNLTYFSAVDADKIADRLKQDDLSVLREMPAAQPSDLKYLRLHLATCETCDEGNYLDLEQVTVTIDKKGNAKSKSKLLVRKLQVAADDVPLVKTAGPPPAPASETAAEEKSENHAPATENEDSGESAARGA